MVLSSYLREFENSIIIANQKGKTHDGGFFEEIVVVYYDMTKPWVVQWILVFSFMFFDSILIFKTIMVWCFLIYTVMLLKLLMQEPRPYWTSLDV